MDDDDDDDNHMENRNSSEKGSITPPQTVYAPWMAEWMDEQEGKYKEAHITTCKLP